jgi:NadR type nicotinamide-nucleotide adenylyltransferase
MSNKIHRIVITGPESTGKTTLAEALATHYRAPLVPEYARTYLELLQPPPYSQADILTIAKAQVAQEKFYLRQADRYLFCDTGLLALKVWSEFKYGDCNPWIVEQIHQQSYDLFLLSGIDVPWEYDPLRESKQDREKLYEIFKSELETLNWNTIELKGNVKARLSTAISAISSSL